jgi:hypothetical protein
MVLIIITSYRSSMSEDYYQHQGSPPVDIDDLNDIIFINTKVLLPQTYMI